MLKLRQLEHLIKDAGAKLLVASQGATLPFGELFQLCPTLETLVLCDTVNAAAVFGRTCRYEDLLTADAEPFAVRAIGDDPAALMYTSGSTGRSKGVVVSHRNLVIGALTVAQYQGNTAADRILVALPLSFDYGFNQVTTAFAVGACAVLTNFSLPAALLNEMAAERITGLAGVPTMWMHLSAVEWPAAVAGHMRYITNSGGALPVAVVKSLRALMPRTLVFCMYGLTEAFRSTYLDPAQLDQRAGSIGKALPGQEVLVLRPDGSQCAPDEVGELVHRGSLVTLGYWNNPQATAARFKPWRSPLLQLPRAEIVVWSGDLVRADSEGYLYFVGRADDLIKSSGYRISATEIEEVVAEVAGVVESAAVGLPDESSGQRVVLSVVAEQSAPTELAEVVRQHCRVHLPLYMVPAEVHLLPKLPRNLNGKCDRAALAVLLTNLRARAAPAIGAA
jgi:acyl-CoA ligase (AMP-forming) (exosortase A-associated)